MATANDTIIKKLNDLIELDFDAIDAYRAAVERLENPEYKLKLGEFLKDHERHTRNLAELVSRHGGKPAHGPDMMKYLTKGKVVIADLVGQDRAILLAMRANEEVTNKRYELALEVHADMDTETRRTIEGNLADERRHRDWIDQQLKQESAARKNRETSTV
jgi:uncharacterized protein (TIGR02284 family)